MDRLCAEPLFGLQISLLAAFVSETYRAPLGSFGKALLLHVCFILYFVRLGIGPSVHVHDRKGLSPSTSAPDWRAPSSNSNIQGRVNSSQYNLGIRESL